MARRMPLRQLLTHTEKSARDLIEHLRTTLGPATAEMRELSRPVRRRSAYPTFVTLRNALKKFGQAGEEAQKMAEYLQERLDEIKQHGRRQ